MRCIYKLFTDKEQGEGWLDDARYETDLIIGPGKNSKFVEVVTVADVSDDDCVDNSLLQIWKLRFGRKAKLLFRL